MIRIFFGKQHVPFLDTESGPQIGVVLELTYVGGAREGFSSIMRPLSLPRR
jgi:hypothetical protein